MKVMRFMPFALLAAAIACGGAEPPAQTTEPVAAPAPAEPPAPPPVRVFFVQPQDGATVKSPLHLEFGIEGFEISPVPAGTVETPRSGVGHHHLGVDADCLPPGEVIPMAAPWVHFGKGTTVFDLQLTPGPHKLALEIGNDQHRTVEGLCQAISITVEP